MKRGIMTLIGISLLLPAAQASEPQKAVCFQNLRLETGMTWFDADELTIELDFQNKTATSRTVGSWGGNDYGVVPIQTEVREKPIQRNIRSVDGNGVRDERLRMRINGFMIPHTLETALTEGAPAEARLQIPGPDGKTETHTFFLNCFTR